MPELPFVVPLVLDKHQPGLPADSPVPRTLLDPATAKHLVFLQARRASRERAVDLLDVVLVRPVVDVMVRSCQVPKCMPSGIHAGDVRTG